MINVLRPLSGATNKSWFFEQSIYDPNGIAASLKAGGGSGNIPKVIIGDDDVAKRIRKFTPRECARLMGMKDEDYDKMTVSESQKYKQFGNSIVIDIMQEMFTNLFVNECKNKGLF